jgi:hypothetical protein
VTSGNEFRRLLFCFAFFFLDSASVPRAPEGVWLLVVVATFGAFFLPVSRSSYSTAAHTPSFTQPEHARDLTFSNGTHLSNNQPHGVVIRPFGQ